MKKYLFMAIAAIASIALVGCKGDDKNNPEDPGTTPTTDAQVVISPKTLEVAVGAQEKLRAALNPSKDGVTISYKSDNEEIATVSASGLVTGVAGGTANIIASAEGYKSDTCVVTVISAADAFAWAGCTLWNLDKSIRYSEDTTQVTLSSGLVVNCITVYSMYRLWSDGLVFTGSNLAGAGYLAIFDEVPTWIITDSIDKNGPNYYYVGSDLEIVPFEEYDPTKAANANTIPAGKLVSLDQQLLWFNDETGDEEAGVEGATVYWADFDNEKFYPFEALLGTGVYDGDENEVFYKSNVSWHDGAYCLAVNEEGTALKEPAEWANFEDKYYEKLPESTPEAVKISAPVRHNEDALDRAIRTKKIMDKFYILK